MASALPTHRVAAPAQGTQAVTRTELTEFDRSARPPSLLFVGFAVAWLLVASVAALVAAFKLHTPDFLADQSWLTYGRIAPAANNLLIFGWGFNAAFAVIFWLMARLSCGIVRYPLVPIIAGIGWNAGVLMGVVGIMVGHSTGLEFLEMPSYAAPVLFVSYSLIGAWAVLAIGFGRESRLYVSQWYVIAALFCFPWVYSIAQVMAVFDPVRGTVQSIVAWWFTHNVLGLWFGAIALAIIYYFIPKLSGRPIRSYGLSKFGFWSYLVFSSWVGARQLIGAPVPAWTVSAGVAASFMMLIPIFVIGINHHVTIKDAAGVLRRSVAFRFITFSAVAFTLWGLHGAVSGLRGWAETVGLTHYQVAYVHLGIYGVFSMAAFGALYYLLPRLTLREWPSAALLNAHFVTASIGLLLLVGALAIGGVVQGRAMNNPEVYPEYVDVARATLPYLFARTVALLLLAIGHLAFATNVVLMMLKPRPVEAQALALFRAAPALEVVR